MNLDQIIAEERDEIAECPGHVFTRDRGDGITVCLYCPKIYLTQAMVDDDLLNALEGGYDNRGVDTEQVISELEAYSWQCETATRDELRTMVEDWKRRNG